MVNLGRSLKLSNFSVLYKNKVFYRISRNQVFCSLIAQLDLVVCKAGTVVDQLKQKTLVRITDQCKICNLVCSSLEKNTANSHCKQTTADTTMLSMNLCNLLFFHYFPWGMYN